MGRQQPNIYSFYGFPIYYRFEMCGQQRYLILSIRPNNRVMLESNMRIPDSLQNSNADAVLSELVPKYLKNKFGRRKNGRVPEEKANLFSTMPFPMVWQIDRDWLIHDCGWTSGTVREYDAGAEWVTKHFGFLTLEEITPEHVAGRLLSLSDRTQDKVIRLMRKLTEYEMMENNLSENPWQNYNPKIARRNFPANALQSQAINETMLPNLEVERKVRICQRRWRETENPNYLAAFLYLTTMVSLSEICALNKSDLK